VFIVLLVASAMLASSAAAGLRGATVLLSPLAVMSSAVQLIVISEASRARLSPWRTWRVLLVATGVIAAGATVTAALVLGVPDSVGRVALGDSFDPTREVMPYVAAEYAAAGFLFALSVFLRAYQRSGEVVRIRVFAICAAISCAVVSGLIWESITGIALGLLCGTVASGMFGVAVAKPWRRPATP
jgi:hypothetical protein